MSYYGSAGDYYATGGIWDVVKGIGRTAIGLVTGGPAGAVAGAVSSIVPSSTRTSPRTGLTIPTFGGSTGSAPSVPSLGISGARRKRRRMNYANGKALTRANRRVDGFVKMARKSLKHTNYKLVTKQTGGRSKRPAQIIETGPGGVRVG